MTMAFIALVPLMLQYVQPDISSITIKFQDSSGYYDTSLREDDLTDNLRSIAIELQKKENSRKTVSIPAGETASVEYLLDACACESPSDSILINYKNGHVGKYEVYCDNFKRVQETGKYHIKLNELDKNILVNKWAETRYKFCPKGYGCSDGNPDYWRGYTEVKKGSAWEKDFVSGEGIELSLKEILKKVSFSEPILVVELTAEVENEKVKNIVIDTMDEKHRNIGKLLEGSAVGARSFWLKKGTRKFRITCFNFFNENPHKNHHALPTTKSGP